MSQPQLLIIGGGVIGLSCAYYAAKRGLRVIVVERRSASRDGCSFGNAGMICPSHFVPLAAPGMVALGLKWMWNPKSPFYIKPRLDREIRGNSRERRLCCKGLQPAQRRRLNWARADIAAAVIRRGRGDAQIGHRLEGNGPPVFEAQLRRVLDGAAVRDEHDNARA